MPSRQTEPEAADFIRRDSLGPFCVLAGRRCLPDGGHAVRLAPHGRIPD